VIEPPLVALGVVVIALLRDRLFPIGVAGAVFQPLGTTIASVPVAIDYRCHCASVPRCGWPVRVTFRLAKAGMSAKLAATAQRCRTSGERQ